MTMDGRSSDGFNTNAKLGSLESHPSCKVGPAGIGSSEASISAMPEEAPEGGRGLVLAPEQLPSCERSKSICEPPEGTACPEAVWKLSNPPKSSLTVAGGGLPATPGGGDAKLPNVSLATAGAGAGDPKLVKASTGTVTGGDANGSSTPKVPCAVAADVLPNTGIESKPGGPAVGAGSATVVRDCAASVVAGVMNGESRVEAGAAAMESWSRGVPSACTRLCSRTELDHDQASPGVSNACHIDVFQAATPGLRTCRCAQRGQRRYLRGRSQGLRTCCESIWSSVGHPVTPVPCDCSGGGNARRRASATADFRAPRSEPSTTTAAKRAEPVVGTAGGSGGGGAELKLSKPSAAVAVVPPPASKSPKSCPTRGKITPWRDRVGQRGFVHHRQFQCLPVCSHRRTRQSHRPGLH